MVGRPLDEEGNFMTTIVIGVQNGSLEAVCGRICEWLDRNGYEHVAVEVYAKPRMARGGRVIITDIPPDDGIKSRSFIKDKVIGDKARTVREYY